MQVPSRLDVYKRQLLGYANQLQEIEKSFESHNEIGKLKEPEKMEKDMAKPENTDSPIIS